jgi:hypothetical protein
MIGDFLLMLMAWCLIGVGFDVWESVQLLKATRREMAAGAAQAPVWLAPQATSDEDLMAIANAVTPDRSWPCGCTWWDEDYNPVYQPCFTHAHLEDISQWDEELGDIA